MAGDGVGQFLFTALAKGMSETIRRHTDSPDKDKDLESDTVGGELGGSGPARTSKSNDRDRDNARMFSEVLEGFQTLMKQKTGLDNGARNVSKESDQGDRSIKERHHSDAGDSRETYSIPEAFSDLAPFVKQAVPTGKRLGSGAFGEVEEMRVGTVVVAGKKFRLDMTENDTRVKFSNEMKLLSKLHHCNVVEFVGVCFLPNEEIPILLMERLDKNLFCYITSHTNIPKVGILFDVAKGLSYIHGLDPPIIHRDLTAKNVLLDSQERAKISDFGNARILDIDPYSSTTMTSKPGTIEYMPPEAFGCSTHYDASLDMFSFGHLSLFVAIQEIPSPILPYSEGTTLLLELERRHKFITKARKLLGNSHVIVELVTRCLQNDPQLRATAEEIVDELHDIAGSTCTSTSDEHLQPCSPADQKPTLEELHCMEISGHSVEIIKELAPRWHIFGDHLGFDSNGRNIEIFRRQNRGELVDGCRAMFQYWLEGNGVTPTSWQTLARLLEKCGYTRLVAVVRILKSIPSEPAAK